MALKKVSWAKLRIFFNALPVWQLEDFMLDRMSIHKPTAACGEDGHVKL
jgi:hypothetical protein